MVASALLVGSTYLHELLLEEGKPAFYLPLLVSRYPQWQVQAGIPVLCLAGRRSNCLTYSTACGAGCICRAGHCHSPIEHCCPDWNGLGERILQRHMLAEAAAQHVRAAAAVPQARAFRWLCLGLQSTCSLHMLCMPGQGRLAAAQEPELTGKVLPLLVASTMIAPPLCAACSATWRLSLLVLKDQLPLWPSVDLK